MRSGCRYLAVTPYNLPKLFLKMFWSHSSVPTLRIMLPMVCPCHLDYLLVVLIPLLEVLQKVIFTVQLGRHSPILVGLILLNNLLGPHWLLFRVPGRSDHHWLQAAHGLVSALSPQNLQFHQTLQHQYVVTTPPRDHLRISGPLSDPICLRYQPLR